MNTSQRKQIPLFSFSSLPFHAEISHWQNGNDQSLFSDQGEEPLSLFLKKFLFLSRSFFF